MVHLDQHSHTYRKPPPSTIPNGLLVKNALIISLERSYNERYVPLLERTKNIHLVFERVEAIDGKELAVPPKAKMTPNTYACMLSHIKAIEYAREKKYPCVLILEDDVEFVDGFNEKLERCMLSIPSDWQGLWLGGKDTSRTLPYNQFARRVQKTWGAYGYIIRDRIYSKFISEMKTYKMPSDTYYTHVQSGLNIYRSAENLIRHLPGFSVRRETTTRE